MTATDQSADTTGRRLRWRGVEVVETAPETARAITLVLDVEGWPGDRAGQHVDIRLTAEDGYQRSYSIASPPEAPRLALTVQRLDGGEVSPWLAGEARPGDRFELCGPIGGYFAWTAAMGGPLCLMAGGSGIAPLMAILLHRDRRNPRAPALLLYSSRSLQDVICRQELGAMARRDPDLRVVNTLTRKQPEGWMGHRRRIDKETTSSACLGARTRTVSRTSFEGEERRTVCLVEF